MAGIGGNVLAPRLTESLTLAKGHRFRARLLAVPVPILAEIRGLTWRTRRKPRSASVATTAGPKSTGDKTTATAALAAVQPELQRGVAKGVLHKNTASRKFSRLTKRLASL